MAMCWWQKSGVVIYQKSLGCRDYTKKQPLNNNSVFELASVSKQFMAMGNATERKR
jgi:CubicO group peptidase (beta-lactamase class C family)